MCDACLELLGQSKDLRVAVTLCLALVKLEGAVGLRDGLALLKGLLERYWPDLYPKLDPEENNDPLERINIIASVSTPLGTFGDPLRFLQRLREIPLANSPQMGWFSLADITGDKITLPNGQEKPSASAAQIKAAFRDTKHGGAGGLWPGDLGLHCARQGYRSVFDGNGRPCPGSGYGSANDHPI